MTYRSVAAVIGSPVAHSLSPVIHRAAFAAADRDWSYVAFEVEPGRGADAVRAMRTLGLVGLSVTMPHKEDVAGAVDRLDPVAAALGVVNTVSWDGNHLVGSSTDGDGFVASLDEHGVDAAGARVVVLGAGGAARSVIDALGRRGVADIAVINRSPDRAARAAEIAAVARVGHADDLGGADRGVNATSVGLGVSLTTLHTAFGKELDAYLGLDEDTPTCALLPIGWPLGKYGRPPRKSVDDCLFFERMPAGAGEPDP